MKYIVNVGGEEIEITLDGSDVAVDGTRTHALIADVEGTPVRMLTVGDEVHRIVVRPGATRGRYTLWLDGFRHEVEALDERARAIRELAGTSAGPTGPAPLVAPMPGMIVRVAVQVGDTVQPGQGLVVMEAMKMENELRRLVGRDGEGGACRRPGPPWKRARFCSSWSSGRRQRPPCFLPGAMASRPNRARTASTARERSRSFGVSSGGVPLSNRAS